MIKTSYSTICKYFRKPTIGYDIHEENSTTFIHVLGWIYIFDYIERHKLPVLSMVDGASVQFAAWTRFETRYVCHSIQPRLNRIGELALLHLLYQNKQHQLHPVLFLLFAINMQYIIIYNIYYIYTL